MWGGHSLRQAQGRFCPPTLTMSKKPKSTGGLPLAGIRVLVGRAKHQAGALSAELRQRGAEVIEIPFIEIRKPKSFRPLDAALKSLSTYDWLILTSVNGVEAMWERMEKLRLPNAGLSQLRIAAIGPATKKAIEQRGGEVDVVPKEYVAESVVRSLRSKVKGKRVLLVRAKVARDVIPRELHRAGAQVDVVEAYGTVVPQSSRLRLRAALRSPKLRPYVVTFTSSSTVRNFVELLGSPAKGKSLPTARERVRLRHMGLRHSEPESMLMASIGPVTSATLRELGLPVDISAKEFTIPGLVQAIVDALADRRKSTT
jgi:uroporphyrinogen-III synthase